METTTLKLHGMSCAACARNIEDAIRSIEGVAECNVNFGAEQATIVVNARKTTVAAIQEAVDAAGYSVQPMQEDVLAGEEDIERQERQAQQRKLRRKARQFNSAVPRFATFGRTYSLLLSTTLQEFRSPQGFCIPFSDGR